MRRLSYGRVGLLGVLALVAAAAGACGSDGGTAENSGQGGASGASGAGGGDGGLLGCTPPNVGCAMGEVCGADGFCMPGCATDADCDAGEFCSVAGVCAPDGGCAADGDCALGEFCAADMRCLPEGSCAIDADCDAGFTCDAGMCIPGGGCGGMEFAAEAVEPNMMIVLDRSCSMRDVGDTASGKNKWVIAVEAITQITTTFKDKIIWGQILFPDLNGQDCQQDAVPTLPVQPMNETPIQMLLNASLVMSDPFFPDGPCVTNIDTAMAQAQTEPAFADMTRKSYALLITDGKQSGGACGGNTRDPVTEQTIKDMFAAGVPTFVVGFGSGIDPAQMNVFADAGGVPSSDPLKRYYEANDAVTFQMALDTIAGNVTGCTFELAEVPPNLAELYVFQNNMPVPRDTTHMNGWDYDPATNQITFYGAACDTLKSGMSDIDIVFGCEMPTPD